MSPGVEKSVRIGMASGVALFIAAVAITYWPPARLFKQCLLTQRSQQCGWAGCVAAVKGVWDSHLVRERFKRSRLLLARNDMGELWRTPDGDYWVTPKADVENLDEMLVEQTLDLYGKGGYGVRPGDIVLDCGANVGVFTRHALRKGAKLVVAIEPDPANVKCLRRTFEDEITQGRVIIFPKGVWDRDAILQMHAAPHTTVANSFVLERGRPETLAPVELTTIDRLVADLGLSRVDFIKMDIEGAEAKALKGARRTVSRFRPRMGLGLEHKADDTEALPALIKSLWLDAEIACSPCTFIFTQYFEKIQPMALWVRFPKRRPS